MRSNNVKTYRKVHSKEFLIMPQNFQSPGKNNNNTIFCKTAYNELFGFSGQAAAETEWK